ncbi:hypothetical protein ANCDUO_02927 [Ancylostoma duodenale]|uniref:Uncharacterized protein n=1 Tax=Ancylostoma duodenale TaxID=51022 RepID=A0A0C2DAJ2_9BILA|nr:hypothetical protein ANCDUO_02927 [Ancylostoma duodenale]
MTNTKTSMTSLQVGKARSCNGGSNLARTPRPPAVLPYRSRRSDGPILSRVAAERGVRLGHDMEGSTHVVPLCIAWVVVGI